MERLRDIGREGISREQAAISQAHALRAFVACARPDSIADVVAALPAVRVRHWRGLPAPALLLQAATEWQIVVDPDEDPDVQAAAVLHQVKHIIDLRGNDACPPGIAPSRACQAFITTMLADRSGERPPQPAQRNGGRS